VIFVLLVTSPLWIAGIAAWLLFTFFGLWGLVPWLVFVLALAVYGGVTGRW
jgi:hypothetical protein